MGSRHVVTNCRWATPTLFLTDPLWLEAWDHPWACTRAPRPRPLKTTDECHLCTAWEARQDRAPERQPVRAST